MNILIKQKNINKIYKDFLGHKFQALREINLEIQEGEFFVLLGPSGCGKSTLLRIMSGLDLKFKGTQSYIDGLNRKHFGFVFQQFALLPWLTVEENISIGLLADGKLTEEKKKEVREIIKSLGLEKFAKNKPRELSGGMKQRVGIARALAINPRIIFLDEPFSALDTFTAKKLREELLSMWKEKKMTIVMVTHNTEEAVQLGDRIAVMSPRPGKIDKIIINQLPRPRELRSVEFFKMVDEIETLIEE